MTADDALREALRPWGERLACELCSEPLTGDRPQPCDHGALLCDQHADECRHCRDNADDQRAADSIDEQAVDAVIEGRAS